MIKRATREKSVDLIERKLLLSDHWYQLILKMMKSVIHDFYGMKIIEVGCGFWGSAFNFRKKRRT